MTEMERIWRSKTDAQVSSAAANPQDYKPEAHAVIRAEWERRLREKSSLPPKKEPEESCPGGLQLASRGERLSAQIIDTLIGFGPMLVAFGLTYVHKLFGDINVVIGFLFFVLYLLFADCLPRGQSWGKKGLGIAVVEQQTGKPCGAWRSFVRNLSLLVLGFFDWIFIFGRTCRRLGDMLAGTIVVKRPSFPQNGMNFQETSLPNTTLPRTRSNR